MFYRYVPRTWNRIRRPSPPPFASAALVELDESISPLLAGMWICVSSAQPTQATEVAARLPKSGNYINRINEMGFTPEEATQLFDDSTRKLDLLDSMTYAGSETF
jgi:hypothetical protein